MDTLKQTRATKNPKTLNGVCGDCSAYIGFVHASVACSYQKFWALKSACTNVYVSCCNLECTLRSMPGGCAYGVSPTSLLIPEYQGRARVPRKGQWADPRKIYGKPTEGGILAPPPPQFEARPNLFPHILNISMEIAMFNFYFS